MTSILEEILPCLVPRFYEVSMDAICGRNRTFLDLLDRVSHGTAGTYIKNKTKFKMSFKERPDSQPKKKRKKNVTWRSSQVWSPRQKKGCISVQAVWTAVNSSIS